MQLSRRDVLKLGVLGSAALALPLERVARTQLAASGRLSATLLPQLQFVLPFQLPARADAAEKTIKVHNGTTYMKSMAVDYYDIHQRAVSLQVLPKLTKTGAPTNLPKTTIWAYDGNPNTSQPKLGGTIVVDAGKEVVVKQSNRLPDHPTLLYKPATSTHLHGSPSLPQYDGYASDVTKPGESKYYQYPDFQKARTLWYHDHGVHQTARNAYMGLAAQYHLHDPVERALPLPQGELRRPADDPGRDLRRQRPAHLRRQRRLRPDGRRHPGQRRAVAEDEGRAAQVPLPRAQRLDLALLQAPLSTRQAHDRDRHRRRADADAAGGDGLPDRMAERYEVVIDFSQYKAGQRIDAQGPGAQRTTSTTRRPATSCRSRSSPTRPDTPNNAMPDTLRRPIRRWP